MLKNRGEMKELKEKPGEEYKSNNINELLSHLVFDTYAPMLCTSLKGMATAKQGMKLDLL